MPLAAAQNVMLGIMCLALWIVLYGYADGAWGGKVKLAMGTLHWVAHIAMMIILYFAVSYSSIELVKLASGRMRLRCCSRSSSTPPTRCASCSAPSSSFPWR